LPSSSLSSVGFRMGEWLVDPSTDRVQRDGHTRSLQPKFMQLLTFLAEHKGEVVSRERIFDQVWEKHYVADGTLRHAIAVLRQTLGDDAHNPRYIETISTKGYRLIADVRELSSAEIETRRERERATTARARLRWLIVGGAAAVAVVGLSLGLRHRPAGPQPARAQVAILPFESVGPGDDAVFVAGMTDEIAVRLSTVNRLVVVPRSASRRYANSGRSAREVGRELGCDYLLEGSVLWGRAADGQSRVRITPRLVRAADGTQVWSEVYDRVLVDTFQVQSDIARQVTEHLHVSLQKSEQAAMALLELHLTDSEEAYKAFLQGRVYSTDRDTTQDMNLAASMFQRAFDLDPKMALASAELARAHSRLYHNGVDRSEQRVRMAKVAAERALGLAPADPRVHLAVAFYYYWVLSDYKSALEHLRFAEKSLANDPELLEVMGFILRRMGQSNLALEKQQRAIQANPSDSLMVIEVGNTLRGLRRYKEADTYFARAIELAPDLVTAYAWRAENLWLWSGSTADARATLSRMPSVSLATAIEARYLECLYEGRYEEAERLLAGTDLEVLSTTERYYPRVLLEAEVFSLLGDPARARAAYEAARVLLEAEDRRLPNEARVHSALGLAYAGLGRKEEAIREGMLAVHLCPVERDSWSGPDYRRELARIYVMVGEYAQALEELRWLLSVPNRWVSTATLTLDPRWAPLRGLPEFGALLQPGADEPTVRRKEVPGGAHGSVPQS
jgi:TolB-like protein/DNA-binding winged helix-turn-helix (wHTH) protein/Flp pilus assembly protein TadD